jgi:hypothetical protein
VGLTRLTEKKNLKWEPQEEAKKKPEEEPEDKKSLELSAAFFKQVSAINHLPFHLLMCIVQPQCLCAASSRCVQQCIKRKKERRKAANQARVMLVSLLE